MNCPSGSFEERVCRVEVRLGSLLLSKEIPKKATHDDDQPKVEDNGGQSDKDVEVEKELI